MIAYVRDICPHCGNLRTVCSDPELPWYPQRSMCYAKAAKDITVRRVQAKYKPAEDSTQPHPTDGMSVWVSTEDHTPQDDFV